MKKFNERVLRRILALILVGVFVVPIFMNRTVVEENTDGYISNTNDEQLLVQQMGNMTGASEEEIIKLKEAGFSWLEVLEKLKVDRSSMSFSNKVEEEDVYEKKLISKGYDPETIGEIKMTISNFRMQLDEIVKMKYENILLDIEGDNAHENSGAKELIEQEKLEQCKKISNEFDEDFLLYLILELSGKYQEETMIINEYLYALQMDIDISMALDDYDAYQEKKKNQMHSSALLDMQDINIIAIQYINNKNEQMREVLNIKTEDNSNESEINVQSFNNPKVIDPAEKIKQEIEQLNPNI